MKALICEMCGSSELVKQDGYFVCQSCGIKYSVEEAKKMMVEGTVQIDRTNEIENKLENAINEFNARNYDITVTLCSDILNIDPYNFKARLYKGLADGWQTSLDNNRLISASSELQRAIDIIRKETTDEDQFVKKSIIICTQFLEIATPTIKMLTKYRDEKRKVYNTLNSKAKSERSSALLTVMSNPSLSKIHTNHANIYSNQAQGVLNEIIRVYDPGMKSTIISLNNIAIQIINNIKNVCEVSEEALECIVDYTKVYQNYIDDSTKANYNSIITYCSDGKIKIKEYVQETKRKEQEEKIAAYWAEHAEEKQQLESEKESLLPKIDELKNQVDEIDIKNAPKINELRRERDGRVPAEDELDSLKSRIKELENQRDSLGLFKGKQKKELQEIITEEYTKVNSINSEVEAQKQQLLSRVNQEISALQEEGKEIRVELANLRNRVSEIDTELTKSR